MEIHRWGKDVRWHLLPLLVKMSRVGGVRCETNTFCISMVSLKELGFWIKLLKENS